MARYEFNRKDYMKITPQIVEDLKSVVDSGISKGYCGRMFGYYGQSGCCAVTKILNGTRKQIHKGKYYRLVKFLKSETSKIKKSK